MRAGLTEAQADPDPLLQFERWFEDAVRAKLPLPNAMTLATTAAGGAATARIVLLKGIDRGGFVFYTNYRSRKGRIEGDVEKVSAAESDAYFVTRPLGARLSAWASNQSETVASRQVLERAMEEARRRHGDNPPRPPSWGGYRVLPRAIEFWQGRADRLHDRLLYAREKSAWRIERLAP